MREVEGAAPWEADDEVFLDVGWESDRDKTERILEGFRFDPLDRRLMSELRSRLDEEEVGYLKIVGEYVTETGEAALRVILDDGTEVTIP